MPGALDGLKVIDLSRVLGGPYCGQMLADHGAEVIKVEPPQGDETRTWGPPFDQEGISAYFAGINRNKRTIALDLSKPEGREVLLKLLAERRRADRQFQDRHDGEMGHRLCRRRCRRNSRASSMPASRASAPTVRWAASRATTPWCRPRPDWSR